jgi:hypothetical protein
VGQHAVAVAGADQITSIVRWLVTCARGDSATQRLFVIIIVSMPYLASSNAAVAPVSPLPTTSTWCPSAA